MNSSGRGSRQPGPSEKTSLPPPYQSKEAYKQHTSARFLELFRDFIGGATWTGETELLDQTGREQLQEMAKAVVATRGVGTKSWLTLQTFRQCYKGTPPLTRLALITDLAVAYYCKFAAYETIDDLPAFDNDRTRRNAPSIWEKYGEEPAILFATILSACAMHILCKLDVDQATKARILEEYTRADVQVLSGMGIHLQASDIQKQTALATVRKSHDLKAGSFSGYILTSAALLAGSDESTIRRVRALAYALAACAQIINDAAIGAVAHDLETNAPNIIAAVGWERTQEIFDSYIAQARHILDTFERPNKHLQAHLTHLTQVLAERSSVTARAPIL